VRWSYDLKVDVCIKKIGRVSFKGKVSLKDFFFFFIYMK
jgi:hypothetical protein